MRQFLKLERPEGRLTQGFAENANASYRQAGLKGHTGEDYVIGFKQAINAVVDGEVYSTYPARSYSKYSAVFQIVDLDDYSYEISYGHLDTITVKKGQLVKKGEAVGTEGNRGLSYSNGVLVNDTQKKTGQGSHLHFQVRKCVKVDKREKGKKYLRSSRGYLRSDKQYYEVVEYSNGYNGCVDPNMFYEGGVGQIKLMKKIISLLTKLVRLSVKR